MHQHSQTVIACGVIAGYKVASSYNNVTRTPQEGFGHLIQLQNIILTSKIFLILSFPGSAEVIFQGSSVEPFDVMEMLINQHHKEAV